MNEAFLHYVWQFQYFDKKELSTTTGEPILIRKPGFLNSDAGPDFSNASVAIDGIDWAGTVEVHTQSSGWYEHRHDSDAAYENVVLHVVWEEDQPVHRKDGSRLPTLQLKGKVATELIRQYEKLIHHAGVIPCAPFFPKSESVIKLNMVEKALMKRLEQKSAQVNTVLNQNKGDWEETAYQLLAASFGFKVNKEPFMQLASALPYKIIQKHQHDARQAEALLFGQAGFLVTKTKDEYVTQLQAVWKFLSKKYFNGEPSLNAAQWKFLRLRPANFPSLRLAQFAALLVKHTSLFGTLTKAENVRDLRTFFEIAPSEYWRKHYRFGKKSKNELHRLGEASANLVIINTVIPLLVAYGKSIDQWSLVDRAVKFLHDIPHEKNKIVNIFRQLGYQPRSAFDSQGLMELYQQYCQRRQCLNCHIGASILKPTVA
jgi:hypothetical protein